MTSNISTGLSKFRILFYSGGLVIQKFLALALVPFIARELAVADFGRVQVLISLSGLVSLLIISGLDEVLVRRATKKTTSLLKIIDMFSSVHGRWECLCWP